MSLIPALSVFFDKSMTEGGVDEMGTVLKGERDVSPWPFPLRPVSGCMSDISDWIGLVPPSEKIKNS